jgi:hypothetical protein
MATVKVTITISPDSGVTAAPDPVTVFATDRIAWLINDNSASSFVINIGNWLLIGGSSTFASPFSKTGNPDFRANATPQVETSVTSDYIVAPFGTTWSYDIRLQSLQSFGKSILADPRVIISGTPMGAKKPKKITAKKITAKK